MQEYDASVPKTLLTVAGRPFAHWQLRWLASEGVTSVIYGIGHRGDQIRKFVGDGSTWGVRVDYVEEPENLLGTAGAVRLAMDHGVLGEAFFVLYGDSFLQINMRSVQERFKEAELPALMTVFANEGRWDTSNAVFDGSLVTDYRKGLAQPPPDMRYIDYGLLVLSRKAVADHTVSGRVADLSEMLTTLSHRRLLSGFEATQRFFEIGTPAGIAELDEYLQQQAD